MSNQLTKRSLLQLFELEHKLKSRLNQIKEEEEEIIVIPNHVDALCVSIHEVIGTFFTAHF